LAAVDEIVTDMLLIQ